MRIGICGGTFDPFHRGHLAPILAVREELQWDRILYIPSHINPFKQERETASGYHRFAMAVLATEGHDDLFVSPRELERGAVSYTVDTLQQLRSEHSDATLDWIIGDDILKTLHEWKSIETIFALANFVVLTRVEQPFRAAPSSQGSPEGLLYTRVVDAPHRLRAGALVFAHNPTVPVSSTDIRMRIRANQPIADLVDARVSRYIHHYGLYGKANRERFD